MVINEEELDKYLATEAKKKGWSDNKLKYAARILRYVLQQETDRNWRTTFKIVIKYLEGYKVEKQVE